jgi:hypothetical protein
MQKTLLFFLAHIISFACIAQSQTKSHTAFRITESPKIDGIINEDIWKNNAPVTDFIQYEPVYAIYPTQKTSVWIAYDNTAIYVAAFLYDRNPDSILHQLGNRDDEDLNADEFGIQFDTYNNQSDAYTFQVSASGVQSDFRINDITFNAVWQSAVKINNQGWCVELKIPYSAIRFPAILQQIWGLQLYRNIRRNREIDEWALEIKEAETTCYTGGNLQELKILKLLYVYPLYLM